MAVNKPPKMSAYGKIAIKDDDDNENKYYDNIGSPTKIKSLSTYDLTVKITNAIHNNAYQIKSILQRLSQVADVRSQPTGNASDEIEIVKINGQLHTILAEIQSQNEELVYIKNFIIEHITGNDGTADKQED